MISVKIIKDRDDRPKGFGYIEFADVEGLKDALAKSGTVCFSADLIGLTFTLHR